MATKIKKNDDVIVIAGKFKGTTGRVLEIDRKNNRIKIDKVNIVKKHVKPTQQNPDGGIQEFEAAIHISNVKLNTKSKKSDKKAAAKKVASTKTEDTKAKTETKPEIKAEVKTVAKEAKVETPVAKEGDK